MLAEVLSDEGLTGEGVGKYEMFMRQVAREGISRGGKAGRGVFGMRPMEELEKLVV